METGIYRGYKGIMEHKMETTTWGVGFRAEMMDLVASLVRCIQYLVVEGLFKNNEPSNMSRSISQDCRLRIM